MKLLVTMPAHNEAHTIGNVIDSIRDIMSKATIIVMCDRCIDNTEQIARDKGALVYKSSIPGLAMVFSAEMTMAIHHRPDIIVHIDSDGQYEPHEIPCLVSEINKGNDLVLGNRLHIRPEGMPLNKYIPNKLGALSYSIVLLEHIPDMTTGFRAFTPEVAKLPILSRYTYTQEQIWRAIKKGYRVKSVPISFYPRADGNSKLISNPLDYIIRSAKDFRRFAL